MEKPVRIQGTRDYSYKGYVLGKYEGARGGVRWMVEKDGKDVAGDFTRLWSAVDYCDQHYGENKCIHLIKAQMIEWSTQ